MAAYSSILAWRIPWTEEPGGYSPQGCKESDTTEATSHARRVAIGKECLAAEENCTCTVSQKPGQARSEKWPRKSKEIKNGEPSVGF